MALLLPQPKERRKHRGTDAPPREYIERYAILHTTLMEIANTTKAQVPDDAKFRLWAQNVSHLAIEKAGDLK